MLAPANIRVKCLSDPDDESALGSEGGRTVPNALRGMGGLRRSNDRATLAVTNSWVVGMATEPHPTAHGHGDLTGSFSRLGPAAFVPPGNQGGNWDIAGRPASTLE